MQYEQSTEQVCTHFRKLKEIPYFVCVVECNSVKDDMTASRRCFSYNMF